MVSYPETPVDPSVLSPGPWLCDAIEESVTIYTMQCPIELLKMPHMNCHYPRMLFIDEIQEWIASCSDLKAICVVCHFTRHHETVLLKQYRDLELLLHRHYDAVFVMN